MKPCRRHLQSDWGCLLQGFMVRYGHLVDYSSEAVSVSCGGIVSRQQQRPNTGLTQPPSLVVEDPCRPGCVPGTQCTVVSCMVHVFGWMAHCIPRCAECFARDLEERQQLAAAAGGVSVQQGGSTGREGRDAAAQLLNGFVMLSCMLDVCDAVGRGCAADNQRKVHFAAAASTWELIDMQCKRQQCTG